MFRYQNNFVTNEKGKVIAVSGGLDNENRNIVMEQKNGKVHQRWRIIYVDEYKGEPTKGQFNDKFGLYVERDFYVVSSLPDNRYLDLINNRNMVIKTKNGRRTQVWYFHQQSLTIRTRYNNQSWDIKSAEEPMTCKSGAQTQDGSKSSSIKATNSSTGPTARSLMLEEGKTLKETQCKFGATTAPRLRDGMLCILIKPSLIKPRV